MYVCIQVYLYDCIQVYVCACMRIYVCTCIHVYTYTCMQAASVQPLRACQNLTRQLRLKQLRMQLQLRFHRQLETAVPPAKCTKKLNFSCENFVILPYVKTLDKTKIL